jgi:hypothetical protein
VPLHIPITVDVAEKVWAYATRKLTNLEDARAARIDNLSGIVSAGSLTHRNGIDEDDILVISPTELTEYLILLLDVNTLTQDTTIRTYIEVDGANYRLVDSAVFPADFPSGVKCVPIGLYPLNVNWKISMQSAIAEGADRNIPYRYVRRRLT